MSTGTKEFDSRLIADLNPSTGEESDPTTQVSRLGALQKIKFGASWTKLIVERMNSGVVLFANVTVLWIDHFAKVGVIFDLFSGKQRRRRQVWGGEDGLAPKFPNACLRENRVVFFLFIRLTLPLSGAN